MPRATNHASPPVGRPVPEFQVSASIAQELLTTQHPDLAHLPLRRVDAGWDNAVFRLGDELALRLPVRASASRLIENEHAWLPKLAARLPLPVTAAVRMGKPQNTYPWHWSVVPWLPGAPADLASINEDQADALARFLIALHIPAPTEAPTNAWRGVPLANRRDAVEERMRRLEGSTLTISARMQELWATALEAPLDGSPTWLHGDLHAQNVLVNAGGITGVIDWGDMCKGDRATDLAAVWMLLPTRRSREHAMRLCGPISDATWARARGWAILFGVVLSDSGLAGDRRHADMGALTLRRVEEGP